MLIRYHPRDISEIRIVHDGRFLCRAVCPELASSTVGIKEIAAARTARRRRLAADLAARSSPGGAARRPRWHPDRAR